jgi:hypothetical protein
VPHCREHGRGSGMDRLSVISGHAGQCPPPGLTKAIKRIGQPSGFGRVALPMCDPPVSTYTDIATMSSGGKGNEVLEALADWAWNA